MDVVDVSSPPTKLPAPLHVVICPWLAFGHLLPYLELADRLASRGHRVSFVSTPRNLARLPAAHPLVDLVALPFPQVDGLPEGAESTNDVPGDKRELHWKAFDGLAVPFAEFMAAACASEDRKPHWVIGDCYHHWAAAAAVEHKSAKLLQQISQSEVLMLYGDTSILIWRYFLLNDEGKKTEEQTGTVRTNCIDCLDRTNVTQSMVGRKILESQLQRLGVLGAHDTISNYPAFDADYKVLWANHGDAISTQYSGTPALKGDFVRYGKRTTQGILNDLWNALARYYLNNFADGTKQDAMDLLEGHYVSSVSRDITVPGKPGALESFRVAFALVRGAAMFMMISLRQARNDLRHLLVALVWAGLCIGITQYVKKNGRKFCNRPRFFLSRH